MKTTRLNARKAEIIGMIMEVENDRTLDVVEKTLQKDAEEILKAKMERPMTMAEYYAAVLEAEEAERRGEYISHGEMLDFVKTLS